MQKLDYLGGEKLGWSVIFPPWQVKASTLPCHECANNLCFLGGGVKLGRSILSPPWLVIPDRIKHQPCSDSYLGGEKLGRPILSPPQLVKTSTILCHEYANNLCFLGDGEKLGRPILSPPQQDKTSTLWRWLSGWRKTWLVRITFWTRLMFNLVRVGKEWAGPVFPHPLKSKGYTCIHDRVRLAVLFCRCLTICTTVFPHLITFWTRLMFNLVRGGKEWAGPVFPHPLKSKVYMCIHDRVRLAVFFCRWLTICTTVFPHLITFCMRLMFNIVRMGKEWVGPVFPHPLTSNFRFYAYSWQGKAGWIFPHPINHMNKSFSPPDNLLHKVPV